MSQGGHLVKPVGSRKTWEIMYRDTEGVLRWEGKFRTKSNAQTPLSEVLTELHKGTYSRPSSLSFEQFAKEWLLSRRHLRGSTEAGYSALIDKQLIPRRGSMKVSRVRFEDIDAAVSGMIGYPITYLGAFCGMRRSEVLGLRFLDVRWFDSPKKSQIRALTRPS